jgi:hypothetical protein
MTSIAYLSEHVIALIPKWLICPEAQEITGSDVVDQINSHPSPQRTL